MSAFQSKAEKAIKELSKKLKVDADFEYTYCNHGWVFFRHGFNTLGSLFFHFESQSSFAFAEGPARAQYYGDSNLNKIWLINLQNAEKFQEVLDYLRAALKGK